MKSIKLLNVQFNIPLRPWQIPQFRGAMSEWVLKNKRGLLNAEERALFHNHKGSGSKDYYYRYPLIQYRCVRRRAAMVVLEEAIPAVKKVLRDMQPLFVMQNKKYEMDWVNMNQKKFHLAVTQNKEMRTYTLQNWIALNNHRRQEWEQMRGMTKRTNMLKDVLAGHIIAFAIGMDWQIGERFEVDILDIEDWRKVQYHKIQMNGFGVRFRVPMNLPSGIGLGKATSHGFGILKAEK